MSVGIGIKLFGKGFEWYVGKTLYTHSFSIAQAGILAFKEGFSFLTLEIAVRW